MNILINLLNTVTNMRKGLFYILFPLIIFSVTSCQWLNPSIMFRTGRGYNYSQFKDSVQSPEYKISVNDIVDFQLFVQDGYELVQTNIKGQGGSALQSNYSVSYIVDSDGYIKLPILGRVLFKGLTIREVEQMLEQEYKIYYNKPFVRLRVSNRRVIIFPGQAGTAKVVSLTNNNMTLLEALAQSGGITQNGKARRVKLIRGNLQNPDVYLIDLSTIEGIKKSDLVLQANDIIYVEPRLNISQELLNKVTPVIGLLTNVLLVYYLIKNN